MLRSHEGPDARDGRDDMQPMSGGYTLDHDTPAGKLMTVFRWDTAADAPGTGLVAWRRPNQAGQPSMRELQARLVRRD